jgi:hypothetical protein
VKLIEILERADSAYPDGMILAHWDARRNRPFARSQGDTLALFVVRELYETYIPDATDAEQLDEAARVIDRATLELASISEALHLSPERP